MEADTGFTFSLIHLLNNSANHEPGIVLDMVALSYTLEMAGVESHPARHPQLCGSIMAYAASL